MICVLWNANQLSSPLRANEIIYDSEVHFVSEVLPLAKWANLTSLMQSINFTKKAPRRVLFIIFLHLAVQIQADLLYYIQEQYKALQVHQCQVW